MTGSTDAAGSAGAAGSGGVGGATDPVTASVARAGLVAILRAPGAEHFAAASAVLVDAGITVIEVTLTSAGALESLASLVRELPGHVVVGAGTVLTGEQARACVEAGARFLVSPVSVPQVTDYALAAGVPAYPGALTPTEVFTASRGGAGVVKLFPASAVGPRYLRDLHGPLPDVRIIPTGGIALADIASWLTAGALAVGVGGPLLGDAVVGGDRSALADRARRAVEAVRTARSP